VYLARGRFWSGAREPARITLAVLAVFSLLLLSRMALNASLAYMGFYLMVPGFLVYQVVFLGVVPDLLKDRVAGVFVRVAFAWS